MRIGIDAHFVGKQGTGNETYTLNLIRSLAAVDRNGNEYFLYLTNPQAAAKPLVSDPRFHNQLLRPATSALRILAAFPWELARRPVDVLHTHYIVPPFLPRKTRTVVTIHDISWEYHPEFYSPFRLQELKRVVPWSARRADRVVAVSESERNALLDRYKLEPSKVVATTLAADENFYPRERLSSGAHLQAKYGIPARFLLYTGNLAPRKNLMRVLQAFAWLRKRRRIEEKMVVVGPHVWGSRDVVSALRGLELQQEVLCTGYVDQVDLPDFYTAAEAFVFPSVYEGFGLPVLEAMACGTPVITSDRGACREVAADAALLVNPEDWGAIANAIERVLSDTCLRQELRTAGLKRAADFSWEASAARTAALYKELA